MTDQPDPTQALPDSLPEGSIVTVQPNDPLQSCRVCRYEFRASAKLTGKKIPCSHCGTLVEIVNSTTTAVDPLIGKRIGNCRLTYRLGAGGIGLVYAGEQLSVGRNVAIKMLGAKAGANDILVQRFQRESKLCAQINHPNVVHVYDCGYDRGVHYQLMELVDGGTLANLIETQVRLPWRDAADLALQITRALEYIHSQEIIHRDIKPANILFDDQGIPHLADLGLAQFTQLTQQDENAPRDRTAGTPAFMAPEQAMGQDRYDTRSDLYSLGATLFFTLTGTPPFIGSVPLDVINQHLNAAPPAVDTVNRSVNSDTAALIRKLLAKRCEDRYANPSEAIADVRRIQAGKRPLALTLTPEQAYAPLKVQMQTRSTDKHADLTPRGSLKSIQPTPTKAHALGTAKTLTPRGNRLIAGTVSTPTPRGNRIAPQRAEVGRPQRTKKSRPLPMIAAFGAVTLIAVTSGILALVLWNRPSTAPLPFAGQQAGQQVGQQVGQQAIPAPAVVMVDLISKLDAKKIQHEEWILRDGVLMSPRGAVHLLPLGGIPPAEYDLTCSFKRLYPSGSLSLIFDFNGRQCALVIGGDDDTRIGFELVSGKAFNNNESLHIIPEPLAQDKRMAVTIKVRRNSLSAYAGEKELCSLSGAGSNLKLDEVWKLPPNHVMGIGTRTTQVAIFKLHLTEFSGTPVLVPPIAN